MPLAAVPTFATPDERAWLATLLSDIPGPVVVGFSGGGDSLALLLVTRDWAETAQRSVVAVIVDHGLRAGSDEDARRAAILARDAGCAVDIVTWDGAKPATGVQEAARAARHRLLADACARRGAGALLLGHTRDDQAETVLMRLERPAGVRALAAIAPVAPSPAWPQGRGLAVARPLLQASRHALRARLTAVGARWIDDPANVDLGFERVRARRRLEAMNAARAVSERLAAIAVTAQRIEARRRAAAAALFRRAARVERHGWVCLNRPIYAAAAVSARMRVLEACLHAASGRIAPLAGEALGRLDGRLCEADFAGGTLAGARVQPVGRDQAGFVRDLGALVGRVDQAGPPPIAMDADVWDGRFVLREAQDHPPEPLGQRLNALAADDRAWLNEAPSGARAAFPAMIAPNGDVNLAAVRYLGAQAAARALFPDRPGAWRDVEVAYRSLAPEGASPI